MIFGNPLERTVEDISQKLDELKNQRKLVELDLEKRILVLENTALSLQKLLGNINNFEAAKDTISKIEEIQNKLRDIEDTNLISRLETVQSDDRLAIMDDGVAELKQKVALLSDAIDILGAASKTNAANADTGAKSSPKEIASLKSELLSIKETISKLQADTAQTAKVGIIEEAVSRNRADIQSIENGFKELTGTVRERIDLLERAAKTQKQNAISIPEGVIRDISAMQKEIERIKGLEAQIVKQIESDAKKLQELKSLQDERKDYSSLKGNMEILQKNVSLLKKEMDLDRTMYPENIMRLERELAGIKATKNGAAAIADIQKLTEIVDGLIIEQQQLKEKIPKYEETIDSLIKNNDALKSGVSEAVKTVKQTLAEGADLKKTVMSFDAGIAGIKSVQDKVAVMAKTLDLIGTEVSSQREETSKAISELNEKALQLESGGMHQFGSVVEKMETDIRLLRKELSLLKDVPQAAGGPSGGISREIAIMKNNLSETLKISDRIVSENAEIKAQLNALGAGICFPEKEGHKARAPKKQSVQESAAGGGSNIEASNISSVLKSISEENRALKSELLEFKALAESVMEANQQLAEGMNEMRAELDEMRQKQPIIID